MATCVPISDLKDTAAFSRKVEEAGEPVVVTKNGYEKFVVLDAELFRDYRPMTAEEKLERKLEEAERDVRRGNVRDMCTGLRDLRAKYGL